MKSILLLLALLMLHTFSISQNVRIDDTLSIDRKIVEFLQDTSETYSTTTLKKKKTESDSIKPSYSLYDYYDIIDTINHVDRIGKFNRGSQIMRIYNIEKVMDSLKSDRIVFEENHYSISSLVDNNYEYIDFSKEVDCYLVKADSYEKECRNIPFVIYYWEFDEFPGSINLIVLKGRVNCYW